MQKIGFIGLGNIGSRFTESLLKAGYPLMVYDLDSNKVEESVQRGAQAATSVKDVTLHADIVMLALPGSEAVEAVMDGANGIIRHLRPGQIVVDTGTTRPATDIRYEQLVREQGAALLDAPLTYRKPGPILMVGGEEEAFARAQDVLTCVSYKVKHVGPIGSGQVLKMINQHILAGQMAVYAEAMEMAKLHDVDTQLLKDFLEFDVPDLLYGDQFNSGGQLALHYKDLGYLLEMAHDSGANIPLASLVHEIFKTTVAYGEDNWLQAGIITYWQRLNNMDKDPKHF